MPEKSAIASPSRREQGITGRVTIGPLEPAALLGRHPQLKETAMAAYMKIDGIDGESTDKAHNKWIQVDSFSEGIIRSISSGARDVERMRGDTSLADVAVSRHLDSSSMPLKEACAKGELKKEVTLHVTTQLGDKETTFLEYKLKDVIVSSYSLIVDGTSVPMEQLSLAYASADWIYTQLDPKTGKEVGQHPAAFDPSKNATK